MFSHVYFIGKWVNEQSLQDLVVKTHQINSELSINIFVNVMQYKYNNNYYTL